MRPVLDASIRILPDLVDFYQWIHIQFSHSLTRKQTEALTLSEFISHHISHQRGSDGHYVIEKRTKQFQMICGEKTKYNYTVEPLYCGQHWDKYKCPDYRGVLIPGVNLYYKAQFGTFVSGL